MLITLSGRTAICQLVAEVKLTGVTPLGAVSHIFEFFILFLIFGTETIDGGSVPLSLISVPGRN
jgi:hypothetical protein